MSTIQSVPTEVTLPTFEPHQNKPADLGKRKRTKPTYEVTSPNKKQKEATEAPLLLQEATPLNSPTETEERESDGELSVWVGACFEENESLHVGGVSVYYGKDDTRNWSDMCDLKHHRNLNNIYLMGALRAIDACGDNNSTLKIFTGCPDILSEETKEDNIVKAEAVDKKEEIEEENTLSIYKELRDQLKEKVFKRSGMTQFVVYAKEMAKSSEEQAAIALARTKVQAEMKAEQEQQEQEDSNTVSVETLAVPSAVEEGEIQVEEMDDLEDMQLEPDVQEAQQGWGSLLGINGLLSILKAPFRRG